MGLYSAVVQDSYSSGTENAVFIPELWADAIRSTFKKNLVLGALANDYSSLVSGSGDKIHIPTFADVADAAEKTQYDAVTYANQTEVEITMDVNQHYYTAAMVEDMAKVQSSADLLTGYADSIGYKLALHLEDALAAKLSTSTRAINMDNGDGTVDRVLNRARIVAIVRHLYKVGINPEDCVMVVSTRLYASLFSLDDFVHAEKLGALANFPTGTVGTVMGIPVIPSPRIHRNLIAAGAVDEAGGNIDDDLYPGGFVVHKDGLMVAYSKYPTAKAEYDMDYIAHKMVTDVIYGCGLLHDSSVNQARVFALYEAGQTTASNWT
tara:strand:- start:2117 stop:3082 length:966 start_codon:yes stop_codon:yes gene_type:complete